MFGTFDCGTLRSLARFLQAENPIHEVPDNLLHFTKRRRLPYIYAPEELTQLVVAASRLRLTYPLRREVYATMFGLDCRDRAPRFGST